MYAVEDLFFVQELDLGFGRMDVDVHGGQGHCDMQHAGGEAPDHELVPVGLLQGCGDGLGADIAAVDKENLIGPGAAGGGGLGDVAGNAELLPFAVHRDHFPGGLTAQYRVDGCQQVPVAGGLELLLAVFDQPEGELRVGQGLLLDSAHNGGTLHAVALHEFHAGGRVEKQIPDDDRGADRAARRLAGQELPAIQAQVTALEVFCGAGQQVHAAHGRGGGQGLAPEAQGADGLQVLLGPQLGGGVPQEGGLGVLTAHAAAVVRDPQQGHAAVLKLYGDGFGAGVDGVLHQLLDHGGGTFHDLAGGDQVRQMGVKLDDLRHEKASLLERYDCPDGQVMSEAQSDYNLRSKTITFALRNHNVAIALRPGRAWKSCSRLRAGRRSPRWSRCAHRSRQGQSCGADKRSRPSG